MTKNQALYGFFSSFDIPAYLESSVPADAVFPYITYALTTSTFTQETPTNIVTNVFCRETEAAANEISEAISEAIGLGGKLIACDDGYVWLQRGNPFCQSMSDPVDDKIQRRYLNITAYFFTKN